MVHSEPTRDMYNGDSIVYPPNDADKLTLKYDFLFTKQGNWYYVNSSNDMERIINIGSAPVEARNECWRVVEAKTGEIVKSNREIAG